jgi:hypothetical protein
MPETLKASFVVKVPEQLLQCTTISVGGIELCPQVLQTKVIGSLDFFAEDCVLEIFSSDTFIPLIVMLGRAVTAYIFSVFIRRYPPQGLCRITYTSKCV